MSRPAAEEYAPYYSLYVDRVPDGDIVSFLGTQADRLNAMYASIPADIGGYRYAEDKWTVNDVLGHVNDVERIFCARALVFSRRDPSPYPSMSQDDWAAVAAVDQLEVSHLASEFSAVRLATLAFFRRLTGEQWMLRGVASGCEFTVRSIAWILAGHAEHHAAVLEARYLGGGNGP